MTNNPLQKNISTNDHYPSKKELNIMERLMQKAGQLAVRKQSIKPNHVARTDGFDVDESIKTVTELAKKDSKHEGLLSRMKSVSDLTSNLYNEFAENKNSILNWYPELKQALTQTDTFLQTPETNIVRLPIELAQFMRLDYHDTSPRDRESFNQYIFDQLELEEDKTYFIKTGTFSSKFQFANAKCAEPLEMGEYFQVINNFAMLVGAGQTVDICAREYIEDPENNPTIYNGMPLRTEFRLFVNLDENKVIGNVPYWHPIVMKRALKMGLSDSMEQDYQTYLSQEDRLVEEFNHHQAALNTEIQKLLPNIKLNGRYSIDVMKSGDDFHIIDMALMSESALVELLPDYLAK